MTAGADQYTVDAGRYDTQSGGGYTVADRQPNPVNKRKKHGTLYKALSFLIICATLVFGISIFFRVSNIDVSGAVTYTDEEIIEASGIAEGDNLFFINRFTAISKIFSKLPYIEEVAVIRSLPNKLTIQVSEGTALAFIVADDRYWIMDRGCKLLSQISAAEAGEFIKITGISIFEPKEGEIIKTDPADMPKVEFLSSVLREIAANDMNRDVSEIDMSNISNPAFEYLGRFTVRMGKNENIEYKFGMPLNAISRLASGDAGILDLSADKKVHFSPE